MSERFPITLTLPFDFTDEEEREFRVEYDHDKNLVLHRVIDGRLMAIRECTLDEARELFAQTKKDSK